MRSLPRADSAFFSPINSRKPSESIAQEKERRRSDCADRIHHRGIADEIRINHKRETAQHQLPEIHPFAVNEGDKTDGTEKQIADQIGSTQAEHVDLGS